MKFTKYVKKGGNFTNNIKICMYDKICKIKYVLFYYKSRKTNLSFVINNLSCFSKNMYLHINPSPSNYTCDILPN